MRKILITGGAGFIGSALASILSKKNKVYVLDLKKQIKKNRNLIKNCKIISGDIANIDTFKKIEKNFDIIYHLAAKTSSAMSEKYPADCFKTNVNGTYNLTQWAQRFKPRSIVFTSSMSVYGKIANNVHENALCKPISNYGKSKLLGEKIIKDLSSKKTKVKILRLFNVYGPNQNFDNLKQGMLSIYLAQIFRKGKLTVTGSLNRYRDFIYIDDVVNGLVKCVNFKNHDTFNIGSGCRLKVKDLISLIFKKLELKSDKNIVVKKTSKSDTWGSYANIDRALQNNWKPKVDIISGLNNTIKNIKE